MFEIAFKQQVNSRASQPTNQLADMKTSPEKRVDIIEHSFFYLVLPCFFGLCICVRLVVDCMIQMINRNGNSTYKHACTHANSVYARASRKEYYYVWIIAAMCGLNWLCKTIERQRFMTWLKCKKEIFATFFFRWFHLRFFLSLFRLVPFVSRCIWYCV